MAYKLIWSPAARDDLHDIVIFIARDNSERAMSFGIELISQINRLQSLLSRVASFPSTITNSCARLFSDRGLCIE
jgi:plasmid stabilization system protein ParE